MHHMVQQSADQYTPSLAFVLVTVIYRVREQSEGDRRAPLSSLSSTLKPPRPSRKTAISAEIVSACIAICPTSEWVLISAVVLDDNMCICQRSRSTGGEISYVLLRSHLRNVRVPSAGRGTITVPSFVGAAVEVQSSIASTEGDRSAVQGIVDCRPVFTLVRSEKHPPTCCGSIITSELFLSLFGPDFQLSGAPVLMVGCQNGNIYFLNFAGCKAHQNSEREFMCPVYSLSQPVVAIHTAYFPRRRSPETDVLFTLQETSPVEDGAESKTHNAVIFVGQAGKIAICYVDGRPFPSFLEFNVPAPVVSSVLVPGECLLYSTLQGLYRICLRQECVDMIEEKIPTVADRGVQSIRIPEVSFKFPEMVMDVHYRTYLLQSDVGSGRVDTPPASEPGRGGFRCLCVSLDGVLSTVLPTPCASTGEVRSEKTSTEVGQDMKQCLLSVQSQSEEIDRVMEKIRSLNLILTKLKGILDMLLAIRAPPTPHSARARGSRGSTSPFACSFKPTREKVGATAERLCVVVEMTYGKHKHSAEVLSDGWSLLVTSQTGKHSTSRSVSLAGLVVGDTVAVTMDVNVHGGVAVLEDRAIVECFLHYSPWHLCGCLTCDTSTKKADSFRGVSLFLVRRDFDILDFLHPHKDTSRETVSSCREKAVNRILSESAETAESAPAPSRPLPPALLYSISLPISSHAAIRTIQTNTSSLSAEKLRKMNPGEVAAALLNALVAVTNGKSPRARNTGTRGCNSEILMGFAGEGIGLKLSDACGEDEVGGSLRLEIRASSRSILVQVVGSVTTRLRRGHGAEPEGVSCDHRTLCGRLEALEGIRGEVGRVQHEISTSHLEWRSNCMTAEAYRRALLTWRAKAHSVYCKLREIAPS